MHNNNSFNTFGGRGSGSAFGSFSGFSGNAGAGAAAPGGAYAVPIAPLPLPVDEPLPSLARVRDWTPQQLSAFLRSVEPVQEGKLLAGFFGNHSGSQFLAAKLSSLSGSIGPQLTSLASRVQQTLAQHPYVVYPTVEALNPNNQILINACKSLLNQEQARPVPPVSEAKLYRIYSNRIALLQRLIDKLKVAPAVVLSTADATAQGIFEKKKKLAKTVVDLFKAVDEERSKLSAAGRSFWQQPSPSSVSAGAAGSGSSSGFSSSGYTAADEDADMEAYLRSLPDSGSKEPKQQQSESKASKPGGKARLISLEDDNNNDVDFPTPPPQKKRRVAAGTSPSSSAAASIPSPVPADKDDKEDGSLKELRRVSFENGVKWRKPRQYYIAMAIGAFSKWAHKDHLGTPFGNITAVEVAATAAYFFKLDCQARSKPALFATLDFFSPDSLALLTRSFSCLVGKKKGGYSINTTAEEYGLCLSLYLAQCECDAVVRMYIPRWVCACSCSNDIDAICCIKCHHPVRPELGLPSLRTLSAARAAESAASPATPGKPVPSSSQGAGSGALQSPSSSSLSLTTSAPASAAAVHALTCHFDTMSISMYTLTATFLAPIDQARLISCSKPRLGLLSGVSLPSPRKALSDYIMTSLKSLVGRVCAQLRQALLVYELADTDMLVVRMRDLPMSLLLPEGVGLMLTPVHEPSLFPMVDSHACLADFPATPAQVHAGTFHTLEVGESKLIQKTVFASGVQFEKYTVKCDSLKARYTLFVERNKRAFRAAIQVDTFKNVQFDAKTPVKHLDGVLLWCPLRQLIDTRFVTTRATAFFRLLLAAVSHAHDPLGGDIPFEIGDFHLNASWLWDPDSKLLDPTRAPPSPNERLIAAFNRSADNLD